MFKTCLIAFGNVFGHSQNVKVFPASWSCSKFWLSWVHWALFFRESYLKTSSKRVWTLLGTFLDTLKFQKSDFFSFFSIFRPCRAWWFQRKSPRNMFELCWVRFWTFLKIWIFFDFFLFFQVSTLQCVLAISFRKKYLNTISELVWTLLGTVSDTLERLKFSIFSIFLLSNLQGAMSNNFAEKISSKHVQNMFDCFWERFWAFWKIESFSSFLKFFQVSRVLGALGKFFSEKITSKQVQTCLDTFRNVFGHFWIFKTSILFSFCSNFRPCRAWWFQKTTS